MEKEMTTHSSSLVGYESDTTEWLHFSFSLSCIRGGNGNPLQYSCLENPRDGGAWWAAVYGVAQSWTQLKRLSSTSSNRSKSSSKTHILLIGLPIKNRLLFAETHVHWVGDAIQSSHFLSPPSPPALNLCIRVFSSELALCIKWPKNWSFNFSISSSSEYSELIFFSSDWFDLLTVQGTLKSLLWHHGLKASVLWCSAFLCLYINPSFPIYPSPLFPIGNYVYFLHLWLYFCFVNKFICTIF